MIMGDIENLSTITLLFFPIRNGRKNDESYKLTLLKNFDQIPATNWV